MCDFDVIIVGAGISGVGTACHLQRKCPERSFVILEGSESIGGTWNLFKYPGVRSDSDMYTLCYNFKPWTKSKAIADGELILEYVQETVDENNLASHIRFNSHVVSASWSTKTSTWTLITKNGESGEESTYTCNFLSMCSGYYSYEKGHMPEFDGMSQYKGTIVHPQQWPEDLDYQDKNVVVIGSGATAMTLVPALAERGAKHVTMVQRSPTWVISAPSEDKLANTMKKILPSNMAYGITRKKNIMFQEAYYKKSRTDPDKVKDFLLKEAKKELPDEYVDEHFTPSYKPWDQRLCLVPDGDLFHVINDGKASVVTETIKGFTENGLELSNDELLEADIIVTATGLELLQLGGVKFFVDEEEVNFAETWTYKGMMFSRVPNLIHTFGYVNASWTLRADLVAEYTCRLLNSMKESDTTQVTPRLREQDKDMPQRKWIEDFSSNYLKRSMHLYPKQSDREPWLNPQNYSKDIKMIRKAKIADDVLVFSKASQEASVSSTKD